MWLTAGILGTALSTRWQACFSSSHDSTVMNRQTMTFSTRTNIVASFIEFYWTFYRPHLMSKHAFGAKLVGSPWRFAQVPTSDRNILHKVIITWALKSYFWLALFGFMFGQFLLLRAKACLLQSDTWWLTQLEKDVYLVAAAVVCVEQGRGWAGGGSGRLGLAMYAGGLWGGQCYKNSW